MPRNFSVTYTEEMTLSDHGSRLYSRWKNLKHQPHDIAFDAYADFYKWAMDNGFEPGMKIARLDDRLPYSPDNCYFTQMCVNGKNPYVVSPQEQKRLAAGWNRTVNKLRRHFGLKPFPVVEE